MTTTDTAWWAGAPDSRPIPSYDGCTRQSQYVTMADGTRIAIDLYLPKGLPAGERIPALISQTPYGRGLEFRGPRRDRLARRLLPGLVELGEDIARYGYATVVADLRGSGASFGHKQALLMREAVADGVELLDWITAQPWSNGNVGATGISAMGMAAMWLASAGHPALKAVAPRFSIFDIFAGTHPGGLMMANLVGEVGPRLRALDNNRVHEGGGKFVARSLIRFLVRGNRPVDADTDRRLLAEAVAERGANEYFDVAISESWYRDDAPPVDDTPLLDAMSPSSHIQNVMRAGVPVYAISGWADAAFSREMANLYATVSPSTPGCRLTLGPWDHGAARYRSPVRDRSCQPEFDATADLVRFFDLHLRGVDWDARDEAPVHYFTQVEEAWHTAPTWPPPAAMQSWYLGAASSLGTAAPAEADADAMPADLAVGTGTSSRFRSPPLGRAAKEGPIAIDGANASPSYRSDPFTRDTEITGHPIATVFVESDQPDATLFVYLEDESPDGSRRLITEAGLVLSLRATDPEPRYAQQGPWRPMRRADSRPLVPGQVEEITLELLPASWLLRAGHRLVVRISGSDPTNFPTPIDPSPTLRIHRSASRPSRVLVPVV